VSLPNDNFLFAEQILLDKISEIFPPDTGIKVDSLGLVADLVAGNYYFPSVLVNFIGEKPESKTIGQNLVQQSTQSWVVIVAVKEVTTAKTGVKAREAAGKIFLKLIQGLQGYPVLPNITLKRVPVGNPVIYTDGHLFMTAQFEFTLDILGGS
jgi:hypothetical protein